MSVVTPEQRYTFFEFMQSTQQIHVGSDLPPMGIAETDPAHPRNLLYTLASLKNQAQADTKYDPVRSTEAFCDNCQVTTGHPFLNLAAFATAAIGLTVVIGGSIWLSRRR